MKSQNTVLLGDCKELLADFDENSISACITDPPYNYEFIGHNWDAEEIQRRLERIQDSKTLVKNIPYGSGLADGVRNKRWYEKNRSNIIDYQNWCCEWGREVFRVCKPGALIAVFNSTRTLAHVQVALEKAGFYARDCIVYRRSSGIPKGYNAASQLQRKGYNDHEKWEGWHSCLRNEWEGIVIVQKPLINNYTETVIEYGVGLFHASNPDGSFQSNILEDIPKSKNEYFNIHCTVKPLLLIEKLVDMLVPPGAENIVLDPFAGSGTTLVAARNLARSFIGIEIIPQYIDIIEKRLRDTIHKEVKQPNTIDQSDIFQLDFADTS